MCVCQLLFVVKDGTNEHTLLEKSEKATRAWAPSVLVFINADLSFLFVLWHKLQSFLPGLLHT